MTQKATIKKNKNKNKQKMPAKNEIWKADTFWIVNRLKH